MLDENQLHNLQKNLEKELSNYTGNEKRKINIDPKILEKLIFRNIIKENARYKIFDINDDLIKKLDLSGISFDNFNAFNFNFSGLYGVNINPQTIFEKDLKFSKLNGVEITGPLDGCKIKCTDFTGSTGAKINPQTIYAKFLGCSNLGGVEIIGPLDDCIIHHTNFTGSKGAKINPQTVYLKDLSYSNLDGVEITDSLDDCIVDCANFTNSKNIYYEEYVDCLQKIKKAFK